jgi:ribonuclease-3 family protein
MADSLLFRSIRTLAWLGDAEFEREVRRRVASRGDYPADRLDAIKSEVVCAGAQAALFEEIAPRLDDAERALARRARNAAAPTRGRRSAKGYRRATALEALMAVWSLGGPAGRARFEALLAPHLEAAIDAAVVKKAQRVRRG